MLYYIISYHIILYYNIASIGGPTPPAACPLPTRSTSPRSTLQTAAALLSEASPPAAARAIYPLVPSCQSTMLRSRKWYERSENISHSSARRRGCFDFCSQL